MHDTLNGPIMADTHDTAALVARAQGLADLQEKMDEVNRPESHRPMINCLRSCADTITAQAAEIAGLSDALESEKLQGAIAFSAGYEAAEAEIARLTDKVADFEAMLDAAEKSNRISDNGNMWRFWSDQAGKYAAKCVSEKDSAEKAEAALAAALARVAVLEDALRYYANTIGNPNDGPWGVESTDFGNVAIAALKGGAA